MILKFVLPGYLKFSILKKNKRNNFEDFGDIHYIGGTEVLPPPLLDEEETEMINDLISGERDEAETAKSVLIEHNLRLVVYIAKKFDNTGVGVEDLISIGTIGLIKAINTYNPNKNIKLATYASRCIENEILMYLRRNNKTKLEVSIDEPLNVDWDGNELLLSDILGTEEDITYRDIEEEVEKKVLHNAINKLSKIKAMVASTYRATSGAGAEGPVELRMQEEALINGTAITNKVFQHQIAENVIPHIGSFLDNGYTTEEMKMQNEGRKIMHLKDLLVTCTCVRVPVARSHSISVTVVTENKLEIEDVKKAISLEKGCRLYDNPSQLEYPMPIVTSDQDLVFVGRIRKDLINENGITLWCCGDQVRKGAATNAVQIAMKLIGLE